MLRTLLIATIWITPLAANAANQPLYLSHDGIGSSNVKLGKHELCTITGISFLTNRNNGWFPAKIEQGSNGQWKVSFERYPTPFTIEVRCN